MAYGIGNLRVQNIMGGMGMGDPLQEDPFSTAPQRPAPPDIMSGTTMMPPIRTQNSVFDSQRRSGDGIHPETDQAMMRIKSILDSYQPETRATDRYNELLDNVPQINNPGILRRIAGAGAALGNVDEHFRRTGGGQEAADRVKYAPFINEMAAWKEKAGPFLSAATNENQRNIQERTLTSNMLSADTQAQRLEEQARQADQRNQIAAEKNAIARLRASGYTYTRLGETLIGHRPDGTRFEAGHASNFNALELEEMQFEHKMAITKQQGANSANVANINNEGDMAETVQRGVDARDVAGIRTAGGAGKQMSPAAVSTDRRNKIIAELARNPSMRDFFTVSGNNIIVTEPEDGWFTKQPAKVKADFNRIRDIVFPKDATNPPKVGGTQPTPKTDTAPKYKDQMDADDPKEMRRTYTDGKILYSHDGGKTWGDK